MGAAATPDLSARVESPELALVDPELRSAATSLSPGDPSDQGAPETVRLPRARPGARSQDAFERSTSTASADVGQAVRRLTELSELEPIPSRRRLGRLVSIGFATTSWCALAIVVAELQPWRV